MPLTAEHIARMDRDAAVALARRDRGYFAEHLMLGAEAALLALLSLAALWLWEARPIEMLVVLLASVWFGILGDALKLRLLHHAVQREAEHARADNVVWTVAATLMHGGNSVPSDLLAADPFEPRARVQADVLIGGLVTGLLLLVLLQPQHGIDSPWSLEAATAALLAAMLGLQAAGIAWAVRRHRSGQGHLAPPRFAAGLRGLLLFLLTFFALLLADDGDLRPGLSIFHGLVLLLALGWLWYSKQLRRETAWLRARMANRAVTGGTAWNR